jgi:transposase-like protein
MELEAAKLCFDHLRKSDLEIPVFVSDRHRGIAKWIRESHPTITHYFDQWHIAKSVVKKMLAASKKKGCKRIAKWITAVKHHIYWCSTTTKEGFQKLILAKWKSFI